MLYRFKDKGPAYGLGYTEGELIELDESKPLKAKALVAQLARDNKGQLVNTGRQVIADKEYTVQFLLDSGVISLASSEDRERFKKKEDINSEADKIAKKNAELEASQTAARKERMK